MYKELFIRKQSKEENPKRNRSKELVSFQRSKPTNDITQQRQISPWESQERMNKNVIISHEQKITNLTNNNEHKRSLQLKKINSLQLSAKSEQIKTSTQISKDFLLLLKKQKHKSQIYGKINSPYKFKKVAKIQMSLDQDKVQQSFLSNQYSQNAHKNPEEKYTKQILKVSPVKVRIQKKLIQTHHRNQLSHEEYSYTQRDYPTIHLFPCQGQLRNTFTSAFNQSKLRKSRSKSNKSQNQKKFTLRDFYTLDPLMCKGDIVSHQQSKATRKYKFRNELAIQLRKLDAQSFLYKL